MSRNTLPWVLGVVVVLGIAAVLLQRPAATTPQIENESLASRPAIQNATPARKTDENWLAELPSDFLTPPATQPKKSGKPPPQDPGARTALSLVGIDAVAEMVWMDAINNPGLPAHERKDLIEDLNEDGLIDKKNPARADLPMIRERLAIIDRLMPEAMDKTNADALAEARKDLINLQSKASQ